MNHSVQQEFSEIVDRFITLYCRVGTGLNISDKTLFPVYVNSSEKIPKSATQKVSRVGKFTLAFSSASLKIPRTSVL